MPPPLSYPSVCLYMPFVCKYRIAGNFRVVLFFISFVGVLYENKNCKNLNDQKFYVNLDLTMHSQYG